MVEHLKNRVLGYSVLLLLAVIIVPEIFSNAGVRFIVNDQKAFVIPPRPNEKLIKLDAKALKLKIDRNNQQLASSSKTKTTATGSWLIRYATFVDKARAHKQLEILTQLGYDAVIKPKQTSKRVLYIVYAGPYTNYKKATKSIITLEKTTKQSLLIIKNNN